MLYDRKPALVTPPALQPLTLDEVRQHLKIDHTDEDTLLALLIAAAVSHIDGWSGILGRCLINQGWRLDLPAFPDGGCLVLPFPGISLVTISYRDSAGAMQALPAGNIWLSETSEGTILSLAEGASWPATALRPDAVSISLTAGYGPTADKIPASLRAALLFLTGELYRNREMSVPASSRDNPVIKALTAPHVFTGV